MNVSYSSWHWYSIRNVCNICDMSLIQANFILNKKILFNTVHLYCKYGMDILSHPYQNMMLNTHPCLEFNGDLAKPQLWLGWGWVITFHNTMTSSNGNIFRVTCPLWGESTSHRWITLTKASKGQWRGALMFFVYLCRNKRLSKQPGRRWSETPSRPLWRGRSENMVLSI